MRFTQRLDLPNKVASTQIARSISLPRLPQHPAICFNLPSLCVSPYPHIHPASEILDPGNPPQKHTREPDQPDSSTPHKSRDPDQDPCLGRLGAIPRTAEPQSNGNSCSSWGSATSALDVPRTCVSSRSDNLIML